MDHEEDKADRLCGDCGALLAQRAFAGGAVVMWRHAPATGCLRVEADLEGKTAAWSHAEIAEARELAFRP